MKKLSTLLVFSFILFLGTSNAQVPKNSWSFGFGVRYPRLVNSVSVPYEDNYGGFLSLQRNFTEHVGLRFNLAYTYLSGAYQGKVVANNYISGIFDLVYYFVPCETISPYFAFGGGYGYSMFDNQDPTLSDTDIDFEVGGALGAEFRVGKKWKINAEFSYHSVSNGHFAGVQGTNGYGILGGPVTSYMTLDVGAKYYFKQGEPSKICQLYEGIRLEKLPETVDYERIENIVKKYIPREVVKEVISPDVANAIKATAAHRWVLVGVNFDFNSARLKPESYPILFHALQALLQNPDMKVEIQGYTDNIGPERYNVKLSTKRAQAVKDYLVAHGVAPDRLVVKGYGSKNPVASNKTAQGRAMNRRIEFKIIQ
jgi:OOP family OmpA-OmpF porin